MFINFWYAAEQIENVTDQPVAVRMLGQNFVLFRDAQGFSRFAQGEPGKCDQARCRDATVISK
jgi:hypothetical protein